MAAMEAIETAVAAGARTVAVAIAGAMTVAVAIGAAAKAVFVAARR